MSIVPFDDQRDMITNLSAQDLWDPEGFFGADLWDPFSTFPSMLSTQFPSIFPSLGAQLNWRETQGAHVFRARFPLGYNTANGEGSVLVYVDDDNMLQISTENGEFMSKFKLPENARRDQLKASMVNGVLTVTVPKEAGSTSHRPDIRVVEISGSD